MADKFAFNPKLTLGYGHTHEDGRHVQLFGIEQGGKKIGHVHAELDRKDPTNVHIEGIESEGQNTLGPRHIRSLTKQLKGFYPKTETVSGNRITGARPNAFDKEPYVKVKI